MCFGMYPVTTWVRSTTSLTRKSTAMLARDSAFAGEKALLFAQELHDFPGRLPDGAVQVEVDPHHHVVVARLRPGVKDGARPLWTANRKTPLNDCSIAVPLTSPSPWAPCGSPA